MEDTAIEAHGLIRRYRGGFEAVRDVSFTVPTGELFALLGTNGAGKTSTMELVEGLSRPTGGQVRVLGHDPVRDRATVRPRVGIMLQEAGFPSDLTVTETVRLWAGLASSPRPVAQALDLVDLRDRASVAVRQLSGGERRRLDLALAVLGRPEVLFLDEPTTGLDPQSRRSVWRFIRSLLADGVTVLLTTHYLEEVQELADRLAIMRAGRIVSTGTVTDVAAAQPARISFVLPEATPASAVPDLPGAHISDRGPAQRVTVHTGTLQPTLTTLLAWAARHDVVLHDLDARSASLEEAFLAIAAQNLEAA